MTNARELSNHLAELLRRERHAMADFLLALATFDREKTWRDLGHASLFSYLRSELRLSAGAAQYRKTAAELVQRFPAVEGALRSGQLCLSSVIELAKVLTPENAAEVLPRFQGLSSRDAAVVAAAIRPVEDSPMREIVTPLAPATPPATSREQPAPSPSCGESPFELRAPETTSAAATLVSMAPALRSSTDPLDAEHARLHITVSRRFLAKLQAAKDALSHTRPGASSEEVLEASLDLMLERHAKRKGMVEKPRASVKATATDSKAIPAAVRREAWKRADARCEWRFESGERCGSTVRLELDHVVPRAHGGPSTIDNVRVLCRSHNQLAARRVFGDAWMDRFTRSTTTRPGTLPDRTVQNILNAQ